MDKHKEVVLKVFRMLYEHQDEIKKGHGICGALKSMYIEESIDVFEYHAAIDYMDNNKPWIAEFRFQWLETGYWWRKSRIKPRIKWLNKQILKLENEGIV